MSAPMQNQSLIFIINDRIILNKEISTYDAQYKNISFFKELMERVQVATVKLKPFEFEPTMAHPYPRSKLQGVYPRKAIDLALALALMANKMLLRGLLFI